MITRSTHIPHRTLRCAGCDTAFQDTGQPVATYVWHSRGVRYFLCDCCAYQSYPDIVDADNWRRYIVAHPEAVEEVAQL